MSYPRKHPADEFTPSDEDEMLADDLLRVIREDLEEWNRPVPVTFESDLIEDLGYDYSTIAELFIRIEDELHVSLPGTGEEMLKIETVDDILTFILEQK